MTKRAAIYARVSTDEQAEKGYSLPSQIEACQRYAGVHDFEVVKVYQDDISGATPIYTRPEGLRLQTFLEERGAEVVIVYQVDRLYRDHIELLITTRQWLRAGVELHFCDIGKVKSENDILLLIRGWAGSDERDKIKERMGRGKEAKVKSGRVMSAAVTPYGYDFQDGQITPNADAQTVKMIFDWYTYGDGEGPLTLREITKRLDAMGIQAPGVNVYKRKRPATQWGADTIGCLLSCETYVGEWMWGKTRWVNGKRDRHPETEPIKVNVPALVSREQFALAQERKEYNKRVAQRNRKRDYLLVGHVRCHCGRAMVGSWSHISNWGYYTCTNARQKVRDV